MGWRDFLDWEEGGFRLALSAWRRLRPEAGDVSPDTARFEDECGRLAVLAQALCGEPVRLRRARGAGGVRGAEILLPATVDLAGDHAANREAYLVQTVLAARIREKTRGQRPPAEATYEGALASLRVASEAAREACAELPGFGAAYERVIDLVRRERRSLDGSRFSTKERTLEAARLAALEGRADGERGELRTRLAGPRTGRHRSPELPVWGTWFDAEIEAADTLGSAANPGSAAPPETECVAPDVDSVHLVTIDESETNDPPPSPAFERAESLDRFSGPGRDLDGSDELEAHLDALEEVELGALIRGGAGTQSVLRADLDFGFEVGAHDVGVTRGAVLYDEWDGRKGAYRKDWCAVHAEKGATGDGVWARQKLAVYRPLVRRLRLRLEAARAGLRAVPRQLDGDEIDLDAAIDASIARCAGREPDPRVYRRQRRRRRDFRTTVLLDVSMSTDSWVDGRRTLDVGRESVLVLGEVAHELGDRLQVLAFASETRNHCRVWEVLGFGEGWATGKGRLGELRPTGYTRVGPAIRHATAGLCAQPAERRLLLLISDAKPTDYDRYEGAYGVADVRKALQEAEWAGVHTHALAIDRAAHDTLPALFGRNRWNVLRRPEDLPEALGNVYGRLTAG